MGRSLMKNAYNLGVLPQLQEAIEELGFKAADIFDMEPDAGLGNGGLGRLAACYLDSMTTLEIPATGYSICYELGIVQAEDRGGPAGGAARRLEARWAMRGCMPKPQETEEIHFGGTRPHPLGQRPPDGGARGLYPRAGGALRHGDRRLRHRPCEHPAAVGRQEPQAHRHEAVLSQGAVPAAPARSEAMADVISKVLYPEDNHYEGKSLRLKQQYFFVSATVQSITRQHIQQYGTLKNFHEKNVIQINDTHPALVIPELMRILIDDAGLGWDEAWDITTHSVAYTNHTVLAEALERLAAAAV